MIIFHLFVNVVFVVDVVDVVVVVVVIVVVVVVVVRGGGDGIVIIYISDELICFEHNLFLM